MHCYLCPRHCHIGEGQAASASFASTKAASSIAWATAHPAALQIDPIEKKPLNHFLPGTRVFSHGHGGLQHGLLLLPELGHLQIAARSGALDARSARRRRRCWRFAYGCPSIAFTYNEPTIWGEYVIDICRAAKEHGLNTVMVTNGYITREAFHDIYDHVDAANIDLKAFTENFYGRITLTHLQPVLETLEVAEERNQRLVRDHQPDDPHAQRRPGTKPASSPNGFSNISDPTCRCTSPPSIPISSCATSRARRPKRCTRARAIAREAGLHYVYEGNIYCDGAHTICPACETLLIRRSWHDVQQNRLKNGRCPDCGLAIPGRWSNPRGKTLPRTILKAESVSAERYSDLNL